MVGPSVAKTDDFCVGLRRVVRRTQKIAAALGTSFVDERSTAADGRPTNAVRRQTRAAVRQTEDGRRKNAVC